MEENKIFLFVQLVNNISASFERLERAYNESNKEAFDYSKKALLENQKKLNILLGKK